MIPAILNCGCKGTTFSGITKTFPRKIFKRIKKSRRLAGFLFLFLILSVDGLDFLSDEIHVVLQLLDLAVHLVDEAVAFLG